MSKLVIIGGSKGLGFAILKQIHNQFESVSLLDLNEPIESFDNVSYIKIDLSKDNYSSFESLVSSADTLIITAGIGQVKPFSEINEIEINKIFRTNTKSVLLFINYFYKKLLSNSDAKCLIISSIAGEVSSPLFSVYGASKASISKFCESINTELEKENSINRVTCVIATAFTGTSFDGGETDVNKLKDIANECIVAMNNKETKHFVNKEKCLEIIDSYYKNNAEFSRTSYDYKMKNNRISHEKKYVIGYLSGTFDLFHIGHLNILKKAKEQCDYLIVGVHESGSWKGKETFIPFEERLEIVQSIKFVDKAVKSFKEDSDAWEEYHFDKLFVGSDYKGSERFERYEKFFKDKGVKIIYFPYTKGTNSTQLRDKILKK